MCRMLIGFGIKSKYLERARKKWIENYDGWGLAFNKNGKWEDWHVVRSNVPIPIHSLPKRFEGIFHIRFATVNREMGGIHPFRVINNGREIWYAHNGVISPMPYDLNIDSEVIGKLIDDRKGNLKDIMLSVLKEMDKNYYGTWNIIAMTNSEAFAFCDGSLVKVMDWQGNIAAISSDERPFENFHIIPMTQDEWVYLQKIGNQWVEVDSGTMKREIQIYYYPKTKKKRKWYEWDDDDWKEIEKHLYGRWE